MMAKKGENGQYLQIKFKLEKVLKGEALVTACKKMQGDLIANFNSFLERFDPKILLPIWRELIHDVDDLLNFQFGMSSREYEY